MARRLALIIGNSVYRDGTLARLMTPDVDVGALAEILLDPELGAFEDANVLINMTSATVRRAISDFFVKKTREDLLLLYFSGHGVLDESGRLHLAVKDTDHNLLRGTAISASFITDEMDNSRSQRQVLVLDCCHSGAFARGAKGAPGITVGTASAFEGTGFGRVVLTATDATQYAWEGDRIIGEAESSLFTHYMVQGLQTGAADINQDGQITIDELYDYVYGEVVRQTPKQTPGKWSYKEQGEIVIARAAQREKPSPIVEKVQQVDEELTQRLEQLYTRGLSAYWLEDWDRAARSFQAIVEIQPDYRDAAAKLAEARRQLDLKEHYEKALTALQAGAFQEAITALEAVVAATPDYKDAVTRLETARKQRQIADLYAQASQLAQADQWQAVINVFDRIAAHDPDYADPEDLLSTAQREFEVQKRRSEIERQYRQALQAMEAGQWQPARQLFAQIQEAEPDFEDVERLLARAETEIAHLEASHRTQEQVGILYEQAHGLARARQWQLALEKIHQIQALDPQFPDPEGLAAGVQAELSREEQEAQRQNELATLYAEAVRLLQADKYQEALKKWGEVRALDPRYPDRQWVEATARNKLEISPKPFLSRIRLSRRDILFFGLIGIAIVLNLVVGQRSAPSIPGLPSQEEEAGYPTEVDGFIPIPYIVAFLEEDYIFGYGWPEGSEVHLTINDPPDFAQTVTVGPSLWYPNDIVAYFLVKGLYDLKPGDVVTLSGGGIDRTHTIHNLAVTAVDIPADTVAGTADTGAEVHALVPEFGESEMQLTVEDGTWLADFGSIGFDLLVGMCGRAENRDEDGNATAVNWCIPHQTFVAPVTFIVTSTDDVLADDGVCTLREAIISANANTPSGEMSGECPAGLDSEKDIITLAADNVYSLSFDSTNEDGAADGDLDIWDNAAATDLIIVVEGGGTATISQDASVDDRVLDILGATVQIEGLILTGGSNVDTGGSVQNTGTLIMAASTISGNAANHGGGLSNMSMAMIQNGSKINSNQAGWAGGGVFNTGEGTLMVEASTISGNKATSNGGGGIMNDGSMTLTNSTVSGNTANHDGGGIVNNGELTVDASTISANSGKGGGGLANMPGGRATIQNGTMIGGDPNAGEGNKAGTGGGLFNYGTLTVVNSIVSGNTAEYGGGLSNWAGTLTLTDSTVTGNTSANDGGGLHNTGSATTIIENRSVISGNTATWNGGGLANRDNGIVDIINSTVSNNSTGGSGGGLSNQNQGTLTVTGSALLGNTSDSEGDAVYSAVDTINATSITGSCIAGNGITAVFNERSASQNATGNWWGNPSGPSGVGPGSGDSISTNVDFSGWLTKPPSICASD